MANTTKWVFAPAAIMFILLSIATYIGGNMTGDCGLFFASGFSGGMSVAMWIAGAVIAIDTEP